MSMKVREKRFLQPLCWGDSSSTFLAIVWLCVLIFWCFLFVWCLHRIQHPLQNEENEFRERFLWIKSHNKSDSFIKRNLDSCCSSQVLFSTTQHTITLTQSYALIHSLRLSLSHFLILSLSLSTTYSFLHYLISVFFVSELSVHSHLIWFVFLLFLTNFWCSWRIFLIWRYRTSIKEADTVRYYACRVLCNMAKDPTIKQILTSKVTTLFYLHASLLFSLKRITNWKIKMCYEESTNTCII